MKTATATSRDIVFQAMYGKRMVSTWLVTARRDIDGNDDLESYAHKHLTAIGQQTEGWLIEDAWVNFSGSDEPHEVRLNLLPDPDFSGDRPMGEFSDMRKVW